ncbi:MAG: ABC transporter ATP-binding protein [Oscillospiraceae bacterium]|jgi:putative ABC transport system ATP-binding protein|nr:ABC transporter ATP-binding protein [Oscillospiraceae bacterium]
MQAMIQLVDVFKIYVPGDNEVRALDGVSLSIHDREFVAIIGDSGSGKSTLMNMLGCLDMPTQGDYYLDNRSVTHMSDDALSVIRNQQIGFIFQGFNLIPTMNALENVELPLLYRGIPREKRRLMALDALEKVGLSGRIHHKPAQMSGGQQQRVAIARAIAAKPPIILADEPTGNLDSRSGKDVLKILKELWKDGKTVILITHDDKVAAQAMRVVRVHDGRIIEDSAVQKESVYQSEIPLRPIINLA